MLHVLYLVHDVSDPAVRRRVMMLREGGARVTLAGFRRTKTPVADIEGIAPVDLGHTQDGRFAQRLAAVVRAAASLTTALGRIERPDIVLARNLEMLALAIRAKSLFGGGNDLPIVYESLDIHRLLLREDLLGRAMRGAERHFARDISLLVTSSPAFVRDYFEARGQVRAPIELVENRFFAPALPPPGEAGCADTLPGSSWRIGWFGALRCNRSLAMLAQFSRESEGRFEVVLRGRPALSEFSDFDGTIRAEPFVDFHGPYRNPEDVEAIYRDVHFAWLIDFFEDGLNSKWLLPNRLYEGCGFGAVPIALEGTETASFLKARGIGVVLREPSAQGLQEALGNMDAETFHQLRARVLALPRSTWVCGRDDCRRLLGRLAGLVTPPRVSVTEAST